VTADIYNFSMFVTGFLSIILFIKMMRIIYISAKEKEVEFYFFASGIIFIIFLILLGYKIKIIGAFLLITNALLIIIFGIISLFSKNNAE